MRVSTHNQVELAIARLQTQSATQADLQDQISSGIRLSRPSQDPAAFIQVTNGHTQALRLDTYRSTITDAISALDAGVATLQDVNQVLTRATQLAADGANASTDDSGYAALANEVDGLITRLLNTANTKIDGRYLFSGTATGTTPFIVTATDAAGRPTQISYQGATERARGLIGPNQTVDTHYVGSQAFQQPGADLFQSLIDLRDDFRNPALDLSAKEQAATQHLAQIQTNRDAVLGVVGEQSANLESMQALTSRLGDLVTSVRSQTSDLESTDLGEAVIRLQEQQNLFQATLGVTSKLFSKTFLDYV